MLSTSCFCDTDIGFFWDLLVGQLAVAGIVSLQLIHLSELCHGSGGMKHVH